jgi:hypothetical protein
MNPQVHVDIHEMSPESTYFFFPATKPINANFPPMTVKWGRIFGEGNAAAFDAVGAPWYTGEDFDLFYPGYGDSWPSLNGAIGMTYEIAGNGRAGAAYRRDDGGVLTLSERLKHHERAVFADDRDGRFTARGTPSRLARLPTDGGGGRSRRRRARLRVRRRPRSAPVRTPSRGICRCRESKCDV